MKQIITLSIVVLAFVAQDAFAQVVQFRVPIALQWGPKRDTVYVGVNSGSPGVQESTYGWDDSESGLFGPLGMYGEAGAPPPDADGNRVRLIDVPGRTEITDVGGFFKYDFRGYAASAQVDTFVVEITGPVVESNDLTITWDSNLTDYASGWTINSRTPSAIGGVLKNMLETPYQHVFAASGNPVRFAVVKTGANTVVAVERIESELPTAYSLEQNFPNPFNPTTEIRFSLPQTGTVTLVVFNLLGQKVADVVNEVKAAGVYSVRLDAKNLASGTYLYRMEVNSFSAVRKLTILK